MSDDEINIESLFIDDSPAIIRPPMSKNHVCKCLGNNVCMNHNLNTLKLCKNYTRFIQLNPMVETIYDENKQIKFSENKEEIMEDGIIKENIITLVKLIDFHYSTKHKTIFLISLFDFVLRNINFFRENHSCGEYLLNEINELIKNNTFHQQFFEKKKINLEKIHKKIESTIAMRLIRVN